MFFWQNGKGVVRCLPHELVFTFGFFTCVRVYWWKSIHSVMHLKLEDVSCNYQTVYTAERALFLEEPVIISYTLQTSF